MLNREEILRKLKESFPYLKKEFGIKRIGIFGSFAKGVPNEDSDIDFVVEFEKSIGLAFMDLAEYLEKIMGKKVDILTPEGIRSIRIEKIAQKIKESVIYI